MAGPAAVLSILIKMDGATRAASQLKAVDSAAAKTDTTTSKMGAGVRSAMLPAAAALGLVAIAGKKAIDAASDMNETVSKTRTVFGKASPAIEKFGLTAAKSLGLSKQQALDAAAIFGTFGKAAGKTGQELKDFSVPLVKAGADLASFHNVPVAQALEDIRSGLSGEVEPLRKYGILLNDATLRQEALRMGLVKSTKEALQPNVKMLASQHLILQKLGPAQGDFAKTSSSAANQARIQAAENANLNASLGKGLLPIYQMFQKVLLDVTKFMGEHVTLVKITAGVLAGLAVAVLAVNAAMKVAAATQAAFNLVVAANPYVLAIAALVALGVAIYLFRDKIMDALKWVKDHWEEILIALTGPVGLAIVGITKYGLDIVKFFTDLPGRIVTAIKTGADAIVGVGKWVINRIAEGVQTITEALGAIGGWVKNRVVELIQAVASSFTDVGKWVINRIVEGITTITEAITGIGGWVKNRVVEGIHALIDAFKGVGGWILDKILEGFKVVKKIATAIGDLKDDIVDAIKKVFSEAIKIPLNIDLPDVGKLIGKINPFGGEGGGNVGPGVKLGGSGVDQFNTVASRFGNVITSAYRPGDDGYHGQNRARDYAGGNMLAFAKYMAGAFGGKLTELIHTPLGFGIKNGQMVGLGFWGSAVNADHFDHVHVALAQGGIVTRPTRALIGEAGPEAVIPLSGRHSFGGGDTTINVNVDVSGWVGNDQDLATRLVNEINRTISRQGRAFLPQTS